MSTTIRREANMRMTRLGSRRYRSLPEEIISEILAYLPAKKLCRFRRVSKQWCSLISNPSFLEMHNNKAMDEDILQQRRRLIFAGRNSKSLYSLAIDDDLYGKVSKLDFKLHDNNRDIEVLLISCCDGLALFKLYFEDHSEELYIAKPSTMECKKLPMAPYRDRCLPLGFGYDNSIDDYKLVTMRPSDDGIEFSVSALKTGVWRKKKGTYHYKLRRCADGVLMERGLHWLVLDETEDEVHEEDGDEEEEEERSVIIRFDLETEDVFEISLPLGESFEASEYHMTLYQGQLCVVHDDFGEYHNKFWVMKQYGELESWTRIIIPTILPFKKLTPTCYSAEHLELWVCDGKLLMCNFEDHDCYKLTIHRPPCVDGEVGIYTDNLSSFSLN